MQISAISLIARDARHEAIHGFVQAFSRPARGFTLLEMIVILFIGAFLTGIVLPQAMRMVGSYRIHEQQGAILQQFNQLALRAYATGRTYRLDQKTTPDLPSGWKIQVIEPTVFANNGMCTHGRVMLISPDGSRQVYDIDPPACHFVAH